MTKQNIVDNVSNATGLTKVETEAVMNGIMATIVESLGKKRTRRIKRIRHVWRQTSHAKKSTKSRDW